MTIASNHYAAFMAEFSVNELESVFEGSLEGGFNACIECCDKHVSRGKGEQIALYHEGCNGESTTLSFAQLQKKSAQFANFLTLQGIGKGDRVACLLPRSPELLVVALGTWRAGAVYQPLFTAFGYEAIEYRINKSEAKLIVTDTTNRPKLNPIARLPTVLLSGGAATQGDDDLLFGPLIDSQSPVFEPVMLDAKAPFLQMFTSGTVGKSKGVAVPLKAMLAFYVYMKYAIGLKEDDKYWNVADPGWAYGLYYSVTGPLLMGVATHFNEHGFTTENTYQMLEKYQISNLAAAPTAYRLLMAEDSLTTLGPKLQLRAASSAGEPLSPEVVSWVADNLGCQVMDHYGQTETGMTATNHHGLEHPIHNGALGYAMPGYRVVVLNDKFEENGPGQEGEFAIDTENSPLFFFQGYTWQEKNPFHGKYYLTGDMVLQNADGSFSFSGRDDDIIMSAGYRIGPSDVESTVLEHSAVAESAAVAKPDKKRGAIIKSYVVLRAGYEGSDELAKDIQTMVRERLSTHAFPREVEFIAELPKTPSGKIQRFLLRNQAANETVMA